MKKNSKKMINKIKMIRNNKKKKIKMKNKKKR